MKRPLLYIRSVLEITVGVFFGIAALRFAVMTLVEITLLFSYPARINFENTAGDALAGVIVFLLARWLFKVAVGFGVKQKATISDSIFFRCHGVPHPGNRSLRPLVRFRHY